VEMCVCMGPEDFQREIYDILPVSQQKLVGIYM
jgi:hypothetical protein